LRPMVGGEKDFKKKSRKGKVCLRGKKGSRGPNSGAQEGVSNRLVIGSKKHNPWRLRG